MLQKVKLSTTKKLVSKKILVDRICSTNHSISKKLADEVSSKFLIEINKSLVNGEEIRLPGHFTFKTTISKPRVAMNLQTKKKINILSKRVPKIKFSAELKEQIAKRK